MAGLIELSSGEAEELMNPAIVCSRLPVRSPSWTGRHPRPRRG